MLGWFLLLLATVLLLLAAFFGYASANCWESNGNCRWWGEVSALIAYAAIFALLVEVLIAVVWLVRRVWRSRGTA